MGYGGDTKEPTYHFSIVKPRPQTLSTKTQKPKTKGPWADTKISWATTPPHNFEHDGMEGCIDKAEDHAKGPKRGKLPVNCVYLCLISPALTQITG